MNESEYRQKRKNNSTAFKTYKTPSVSFDGKYESLMKIVRT